MATLAAQLTHLVAAAAAAAGHADAPVPLEPCVPTNDARHGDYQSNFAFRLGKALRTNPRAVAQALVDALPDNELIASAEVAGPGFVNFRLADAFLAADVAARDTADLGGGSPGAGLTMVIDYSSPNIAKRMHVGHLRSTIIGDAIARLYRFLGWAVIADNHIGDWGTQFGILICGWERIRDDTAFEADPVAELQRIYQEQNTAAKVDPALMDEARAATARLQAGDPGLRALWQRFVDASLVEFDGIYQRLGVHFDATHGESFYHDDLGPLVERLLADGTAAVDEGSVVIPFGDGDGKGLADQPLRIRKSDGAFLYGTTDLATVAHRLRTWAPQRIVYVTDNRQALHFRQVFAAVRKLGVEVELEHVMFGTLRMADGQIASTRAGATLNLVDVLDTARDHARAVVEDKSAHLPDDEKRAIAEAVGVGSIKYADLSQNPASDIVFEWEKMLAMDGNTAPYLMYAHARCRSILRKAADEGLSAGPVALGHPAERDLALAVARTAEAVLAAAATYRPNLLADHLFGLAGTFSSFYRECRVLGDDVAPDTTASRLALVSATARAMSVGLSLLGIEALERM